MASSRNRANPPPPSAPGSARQNEYFVPRDGIDREVITADVCRYLGNDALVRPGTYEHPDGRVTQGYYITAYRNLTSAMIQDLKADSSRWDQERRAASRPSGNTAGAPSRGNDGYRNSETHQQRQYYGPSSTDPSYGDAMAIDPPTAYNSAGARYPGTGNSGYNGVNSGASYAGHGQRYEPSGAFPQATQFAAPPQQQYAQGPQPTDMYTGMPAGSAPMVPQPFGQRTPAQDSGQYVQGAQYRQQDPVATSSLSSRTLYQTSGPSYPPATDYASYAPAGGAATVSPFAQPQSIDTFYGRGTQPPQTGYSAVPEQQYDASQPPSRPSVPSVSTQAQTPSSIGATTSRRDRDQDRHRERERDRERDRGDRDDRHAAERHAHRHRTRP